MRLVAIGWLALVAPQSGSGTVGIAWHDEATVDEATRQRLVDALVDVAGISSDEVIPDAVDTARHRIAYQIDRDALERLADLRSRLEEGARAYRAGQLDEAEQTATEVGRLLEVDPGAPGSTRLAWQAHVLRAQVAWTRADDAAMTTALQAAIALDPEAHVSTRRAPPSFAAEYERVRQLILGQQASWPTPEISVSGADPYEIDIDGRPGVRPVPPGVHFVVVHRLGRLPKVQAISTDAPWDVPPTPPVIADAMPDDRTGAQRLCDHLELDRLLLARVRNGRWGLQGYDCGRGFGGPWYEGPQSLRDGVRAAVGHDGERFDRDEATIGSDRPWPAARVATTPPPKGPIDRPKPWFRRWWVWTLVGAAVVGGVTAGAVVGTRDSGRAIGVDNDTFVTPQE